MAHTWTRALYVGALGEYPRTSIHDKIRSARSAYDARHSARTTPSSVVRSNFPRRRAMALTSSSISSILPASETTRTSAFWHLSLGTTPRSLISDSSAYASSAGSTSDSPAPDDAKCRHALSRHPNVTTVGDTPAAFILPYVSNAAFGSPPLLCASMSAV